MYVFIWNFCFVRTTSGVRRPTRRPTRMYRQEEWMVIIVLVRACRSEQIVQNRYRRTQCEKPSCTRTHNPLLICFSVCMFVCFSFLHSCVWRDKSFRIFLFSIPNVHFCFLSYCSSLSLTREIEEKRLPVPVMIIIIYCISSTSCIFAPIRHWITQFIAQSHVTFMYIKLFIILSSLFCFFPPTARLLRTS